VQTQVEKVLLTDYAWPDTSIEAEIVHRAGFELVTGPARAGNATEIEALAKHHQPAAIMTNWAPVSAKTIEACPELRIVARLGVGLDNIAVEVATARGVWVTNVPDYCVEEVSDHALSMLLAWTRGLVPFDRAVKHGNWNPAGAKLRRLAAMTVGVLGYGRIARRTVDKLAAFGPRILVFNRSRPTGPAAHPRVEFVKLDELLAVSDAVIVHLPLTTATNHLLDGKHLGSMRRGTFLINVSRGAVVDSVALEHALDDGRLAGAGLDVIEGEPDPPRSLVERPNVIVTPHVAFSSDVSIRELRQRAADDVVAALSGERPRGACNDPKLGTRARRS
jgi:D-3-phosphoglycerate dehydrogenase